MAYKDPANCAKNLFFGCKKNFSSKKIKNNPDITNYIVVGTIFSGFRISIILRITMKIGY